MFLSPDVMLKQNIKSITINKLCSMISEKNGQLGSYFINNRLFIYGFLKGEGFFEEQFYLRGLGGVGWGPIFTIQFPFSSNLALFLLFDQINRLSSKFLGTTDPQ